MRRRAAFALVGVASVLVVGGVTWHRLASGGEVTEIGVADALERFRDAVTTSEPSTPGSDPVPSDGSAGATSTTPTAGTAATPAGSAGPATSAPPVTSAPSTSRLPTPGVYTYATDGFDTVDALTGARHDYPALTTITVVPHDCGVRLRWDVADERWDTWDWCLDGDAVRLTGWVGYHEFFDVGGRNDYRCEGDPRPLDAAPGTTWTTVCRMEDRTTSTFVGEVIERTELEVAGIPVPVLHLRIEAEVVGESVGSQVVEGWYRVDDGLPVREQLTITTAQQTVIGSTNFTEEYTIDLQALEPLS